MQALSCRMTRYYNDQYSIFIGFLICIFSYHLQHYFRFNSPADCIEVVLSRCWKCRCPDRWLSGAVRRAVRGRCPTGRAAIGHFPSALGTRCRLDRAPFTRTTLPALALSWTVFARHPQISCPLISFLSRMISRRHGSPACAALKGSGDHDGPCTKTTRELRFNLDHSVGVGQYQPM